MKILVPIRELLITTLKLAKSDESGVDLNNVKMAINPFCELL